ncbi:MAG TPA: DUF4870 domain-containing protein [bacterium]
MSESSNQQIRNWGLFCHLSALSLWLGVPFGNVIIPLLVWLIKKDDIPLVDREGKESLNFQISFTLYGTAIGLVGVLAILMTLPDPSFPWLQISVLVAVVICHISLVIYAAIKVSNDESYKYPLTIRFLK